MKCETCRNPFRWLRSVLPVLSAVVLVLGLPVAAQSEAAFGDPGQVFATGSLAFQNVSASGYSASATVIAVTGGAHWFVASNWAIAADLLVGHSSAGTELTAFGLVPSVGYNLRLTPSFSLLPQFEASFQTQSASSTAGGNTSTIRHLALGGFLPLMVHPPGHFFVGIGPEMLADVSTSVSGLPYSVAKNNTIGVRSVIGAWF